MNSQQNDCARTTIKIFKKTLSKTARLLSEVLVEQHVVSFFAEKMDDQRSVDQMFFLQTLSVVHEVFDANVAVRVRVVVLHAVFVLPRLAEDLLHLNK